MTRRIFLLAFLLLNHTFTLLANSDSLNINYKQKIASLFVVSVDRVNANSEYRPGYILTNDKTKFKKQNQRENSRYIIDLREGLRDDLVYSFPSRELLSNITVPGFIDSLNKVTLRYETQLGADGIMVHNSNGINTVTILTDSSYHSKDFQVVAFPKVIKKKIPLRGFDDEWGYSGGYSYRKSDWLLSQLFNWNGNYSLNLTFEELLDKGVLFYTENFEVDFNRLVRVYENNLLEVDSKIEQKYKVDRVVLNDSIIAKNLLHYRQEQVGLRLAAFRNTIALYQKKQIFPIIYVDSICGLISDFRIRKNNDFSNRARFYASNLDVQFDTTKNYNFFIALCDNQEELITISEEIRTNPNLAKVNKVLVTKGLGESFFNSTLLSSFDAILVANDEPELNWDLLAQALFNAFDISGVNSKASHLLDVGFASVKLQKTRLAFTVPEAVGLNTDTLNQIDEIINKAIRDKATPGAQILVARKGAIIWQQSYGYHTYSRRIKTTDDDLYDLASVTKLCATLPMVMDMYEKKLIDINDSLIHYLPGIDTTDKRDITIKELLLHQAGLRSFIPFYTHAIDQESLSGKSLHSSRYSAIYNIKLDNWYYQNRYAKYRKDVFRSNSDSVFSIRVSSNMYMNKTFIDTMKAMVYTSELRKNKNYLYSDIGYDILHLILHEKLNIPLDQYYYKYYTQKLGADKVLYNPLSKYDKDEIVPTENDKSFRKELLDGYVHDQGAAMLGGVAANAGIFANAGDLAKVCQMLLNKGSYGGLTFFNPETIDYFTSKQDSVNRRGLGVDKPETDPEKISPSSLLVSPSSYGHTGYTGTMVWMDPKYELVYIFLSNRIHPHSYNKKLIVHNVRTNIQDVIYQSVSE
nr:serine hydrolase [uncultured Carboxylicivirga sp.]